MTTPILLTIVLNYKTPDMTLEAVRFAIQELRGISGELLVVDNDSRDGSFARLTTAIHDIGQKSNVQARVIRSSHNGGFGAGNNLGIRAGLSSDEKPDYIYILNSDAFPDVGAIGALVNFLERNPEVGIAGSYIHGPDSVGSKIEGAPDKPTAWSEPAGAPHRTAFRFPSLLSEFEGAIALGPVTRFLKNYTVPLPIPESTCKVDWVAGTSFMIRQNVLDEVGLFDERFFLYFEETDLCRRASLSGWSTAYVRDSKVTHIGGVSTGMSKWTRVPSYWFDSRLYYFIKNHGIFYAIFATILHLIGAVLRRFREYFDSAAKARGNPPKYTRDLVRHALTYPFRKRELTGDAKLGG